MSKRAKQGIRAATPWSRLALYLAVGVAILLAGVGIWHVTRPDDVRGDLYAFDARDGKMAWHVRLPGVGPRIAIRGDMLAVETNVGECDVWRLIFSTFDTRTGRTVKQPVTVPDVPNNDAEFAHFLDRTQPQREVPGSPASAAGLIMAHGVVGVRGRAWRANVPDRWRWGPEGLPVALRYRGLVFVAVTGKWKKPCNE